MVLALNGQVTHNRGGHPYVVVYETDPALRALEAISGKNRIGSSPRGARTFHAPVSVTINGVEHVVTGIGDFFYDEETTTEMRRTARGKPKYTTTTTRVEGSGRRYVYLQERHVAEGVGPAARDEDIRRAGTDDWAQPISDRPATGRGIDA
jgi:hypothetical protein